MTLQEAIKSGKRFKRLCETPRSWRTTGRYGIQYSTERIDIVLSTDDILAEDWEVEEKKIEITKSQLLKAIDVLLHKATFIHSYGNSTTSIANFKAELADWLGFKD